MDLGLDLTQTKHLTLGRADAARQGPFGAQVRAVELIEPRPARRQLRRAGGGEEESSRLPRIWLTDEAPRLPLETFSNKRSSGNDDDNNNDTDVMIFFCTVVRKQMPKIKACTVRLRPRT